MKKIEHIKPSVNVPNSLRKIADDMDNDLYDSSTCTLIIGSDIFHLGTHDDDIALKNSIFDMTWGIHKLMTLNELEEE